MFNVIVWATDGSENADDALPHARKLAEENHASLVVAHCIETFVNPRTAGMPVNVDEDDIAAKVERQAAELRDGGVDAELRTTAVGAPGAALAIAEIARDVDADLIIVGTRGRTTLAGLLLGSVTQRLLHVAPCPVLAVPAARSDSSADTEAAGAATA